MRCELGYLLFDVDRAVQELSRTDTHVIIRYFYVHEPFTELFIILVPHNKEFNSLLIC
jgi:hypothetical protein